MCIHCVCLCVDVCVSLTVSLCSPPCSVSSGCRHTHNKPRPPSPAPPRDSSERANVALRKGRVNMLLPPFIHPSILPAVEHKTNTPHHRSACRASVYPSICLSFIPRSRHAIPSHALLHSFPSSGSMAVIPPSPSFDPPPHLPISFLSSSAFTKSQKSNTHL